MYPILRKTSILIFILLVAAGCGAHRLHQAQDSFNAASRIEAQVSLEDAQATGDPLDGDLQALRSYRVALALTNEALDKYDKSLKEDDLYGTALMLKALCQWRIAALDRDTDPQEIRQIVAEIENRIAAGQVTLGTRDRVLLKALPGLHEHELGLQQDDPQKAGRLFESALSTLENALDQINPPQDHPVRAYIRLAQMRSLRAWRWVDYVNRPSGGNALTQWHQDWNSKYQNYRNALVPLMAANPGLRARVETMDHDFGYEPQ